VLTDWDVQVGQALSKSLASFLGVSDPDKAWLTFACQADIEDSGGTSYGAQHNNPLNVLPSFPHPWNGQTGTGPAGFANFDTLEHGIEACAYVYAKQGAGQTYKAVQDSFNANDPISLAKAIEDSPWDAGHYGSGNLSKKVQENLNLIGGETQMPIDNLKISYFTLTGAEAPQSLIDSWTSAGSPDPVGYVKNFILSDRHSDVFHQLEQALEVHDTYDLDRIKQEAAKAQFDNDELIIKKLQDQLAQVPTVPTGPTPTMPTATSPSGQTGEWKSKWIVQVIALIAAGLSTSGLFGTDPILKSIVDVLTASVAGLTEISYQTGRAQVKVAALTAAGKSS
jgi:hypothetical protein